MELNWGSFYSEYVQLACENRTESPRGSLERCVGPAHMLDGGPSEGQCSGLWGHQSEAREGAIGRSHGKEGGQGGPQKGIYSRGTIKIKGNYVTLVFCKRSRNVSN